MPTVVWKKHSSKKGYRVEKENGKEDKKYEEGRQRQIEIDNGRKVRQRDQIR